MRTEYGIAGQPAPEFRVPEWLANTDGELFIADIVEPIIYLYNFQAWCPGCHSSGFPSMKRVKDGVQARGLADQVKFVAVQTAFEGHEANTADQALASVARHGLTDVALGHDSGDPPTIMADYRTAGTPWTVIIGPGPDRTVLHNAFHVEPEGVIGAFSDALANFTGR